MIGLTIKTSPQYRQYQAKVKRAASGALLAAGKRLKQLVKMELNDPAGAKYVKIKRSRGGKKNKTQRTIYTRPSRPGQPPHKRTGNLQRNIILEHDSSRPAAQVGWRANAIYGFYHDQGIRYSRRGMQKRPHMMATFHKYEDSIRRVAMGSFRRRMK